MPRLWEKGKPLDQAVLMFTVGEDHLLDERLVRHDIRATAAHARMLASNGYLAHADLDRLEKALASIGEEHAAGAWHIRLDEEDAHTALENRLVERLGDLGKRIHLGRSRNDQVLVALRLWMKEATDEVASQATALADALDALATRQGAVTLPGYTHMQRAMPSSVALWAGGFASEIRDDVEGVLASRRRADKNPLGSAAGYGVPVLDIDRERTRELLGFRVVHEPVTAVQISRGKAEAGILFECTLLLQDVGRLAADLCLFATAEFGFVTLDAAFTTGSSIMPQKRNPDVLELVRAQSAVAASDLHAALALLAKMPSGYHRDMQLLKAPLFRGVDRTLAVCSVMTHVLAGVAFDAARTNSAMDRSLYATQRAYEIVRDEGVPFRAAYRRVADELAGEQPS